MDAILYAAALALPIGGLLLSLWLAVVGLWVAFGKG